METDTAPGRRVVVTGLPGSGKTTLAIELARSMPAVRMCPDDWMRTAGIDQWDASARARIEEFQLWLSVDLLVRGHHAVIEWGAWTRVERDALREAARSVGAPVELRHTTADPDELWRRIAGRDLEGRWGSRSIERHELEQWLEVYETPTPEEFATYDEPERVGEVPTSDMADAAAVMGGDASVLVTPMLGGSSARVARLDLVNADGARRVVCFRQHLDRAEKGHDDGIAAKEFHLTAALADAGLPVPRPLALHDGRFVDGPWLVTDVVSATTAVGRTRELPVVDEMATFLARLHEWDADDVSVPGLGHIEDPVAALPSYVADDDLGREVLRALDDVHEGPARRPNPDRLLHGDFWPGNVLLRTTSLVAVVDWEDAQLGDPLADLACARVELAQDSAVAAADRFTTTYRRLRPEVVLDDLAIWDVYVSATALSGMHLWGLSVADEHRRRSATTDFLRSALSRLRSRS